MQFNKTVQLKHSNRERWRDYGLIYIIPEPARFVRPLALNKWLLDLRAGGFIGESPCEGNI